MRLVIADDSLLIREGLERLLVRAGATIVGTAADAPTALREVLLSSPDAAIIDIKMPPDFTDDGIRVAHQIRRAKPSIGVLVLSHYVESEWALRLIDQAPDHMGYLLKDRVHDTATLLDALHRVVAGECVVDPGLVDRLVRRPRTPSPLDNLTARERDVLGLIAEGRSNYAIAERLGLSIKTLEAHVRSIMQRLGLEDSPSDNRRVLAVLQYLRAAG